jgi:hypothetical protein
MNKKVLSLLTVSGIAPITIATLPTVALITGQPTADKDLALGLIVIAIVLLAISYVISRLKVTIPKPA